VTRQGGVGIHRAREAHSLQERQVRQVAPVSVASGQGNPLATREGGGPVVLGLEEPPRSHPRAILQLAGDQGLCADLHREGSQSLAEPSAEEDHPQTRRSRPLQDLQPFGLDFARQKALIELAAQDLDSLTSQAAELEECQAPQAPPIRERKGRRRGSRSQEPSPARQAPPDPWGLQAEVEGALEKVPREEGLLDPHEGRGCGRWGGVHRVLVRREVDNVTSARLPKGARARIERRAMNVLVIQPGFPAEIPYFVRGLAHAGIRVLGVGDQPASSLPAATREALSGYLQVGSLWDAPALIRSLRAWDLPLRLDRVECLWEVAMGVTAEVRAAFGLPGLSPTQTELFRDKHKMRNALDRAGIRNPRHARATSEGEVWAAAEHVGFPLILKPVAGAGSADTYRVDDAHELRQVLLMTRHVPEVVVEEFIKGTEYTFDTLCSKGRILFHNIELYRPDMLTARTVEECSPQTISLRDLSASVFQRAYAMGQAVIDALGYETGFTHMEWFHTEDDEVVFGEIAGRPPGGCSGELMNRTCDFDVYRAWGEVLRYGLIRTRIKRQYNVAMVFKRAHGQGRIQRIEGLRALERELGPALVRHDLRPPGSPRRNWRQTLLSDGFVMLRHPDLATTLRMADAVDERLHIHAGA
jgi:hypothetical protein